jgi:hypothetical protein
LAFISQSFFNSQRRAPRHPARGLFPFQGKGTNQSVDAVMKHDLIQSHGIIVHILVFSRNVGVCLLDRIITLGYVFLAGGYFWGLRAVRVAVQASGHDRGLLPEGIWGYASVYNVKH